MSCVAAFVMSHGRLPVYAVWAAVGLMAALWLSQRTAARVGIRPEALWDADVVAVVGALVVSRVLLVVQSPRAFLEYPMLVLALPSLTLGGMVITAAVVWGYLRWKRMAVLDVMDAWAPGAAVLAAALELGHFFEGSDAGMPTGLPWGVVERGAFVLGATHPVGVYAAVVALGIAAVLLWRLGRRGWSGEVAALGLVLGGVSWFLLDMLRQPEVGGGWLEGSQWVGLGAVVMGMMLWWFGGARAPRLSGQNSGVSPLRLRLRSR
jgi:phosphatidylglycerol---prolipoprotein diacylglyceryl transferase